MKKILTASLVAMMAVSAAHADLASTAYVTGKTGDLTYTGATYVQSGQTLTASVKALDTAIKGVAAGNITIEENQIKDNMIDSVSLSKVTGAQDALALKEDLANKYQEADKPAEFDSWDQAKQQAWLKQHYASVNYVDAQIDQVAGTAADLSTTVENLGLNKQDNLSSADGGNVTVGGTAKGAVTTVTAADGKVTFTKSLVTSDDIENETILSEDIKDGTIDSVDIEDGTIATVDIANEAVTEAKLSSDVQTKLNASELAGVTSTDTETQSVADGQYALTKVVKDGVVSYHWDLISY